MLNEASAKVVLGIPVSTGKLPVEYVLEEEYSKASSARAQSPAAADIEAPAMTKYKNPGQACLNETLSRQISWWRLLNILACLHRRGVPEN
mmetsp:Transcript_8858/g.21159  ORF Transcript_8858/g.21159 Transcript_8858/m.21159 type:complete len:91 (+) Transcript_8858:1953-2225(+)